MVFSKLKYLNKLVDLEGMKRIVTTHFFGMIYYSSQVWLNEQTTSRQWRMIISLHYKALRSAIGDYKNNISKRALDSIFKRANPYQWMNYSNAKVYRFLLMAL